MRARHGLTLLEVLIATALLAIMAGACVPTMAQALRALHADDSTHDIDANDLARCADALLAQPEVFGLKAQQELLDSMTTQLPWPVELIAIRAVSPPPVHIKVLRHSDPEIDHVWFVFECDGHTVHRWLALPDPEEAAQP